MYVQIGRQTLGSGYGTGAYGGGAYGAATGGTTCFVQAGSLSISDAINQRTTCRFTVVDVAGANHFLQGTQLSVYDDTNTLVFGGFVAEALEEKPGIQAVTLLHRVTGMDNHYLADKRVVATSYPGGTTCGAIATDLITHWLGAEGVVAGTIQAGPTTTDVISFNYKTAAQVLDSVAQLAGFSWYIDATRHLHFFTPSTFVAPWTFDGTQPGTFGTTTVEHFNKGYRNSQYVVGFKEVTATQTESHKGDGASRAFTLAYPIHQVPTNININGGAAQTLGIKGIDTGKQFYWSKGDPVLQQDTSGTLLATTDTLNVTYKGEFNAVTYSQNQGLVLTEQTREGVGTGIVEEVTSDSSLTSVAQAFQSAAALLAEYGQDGTLLTFKTTQGGLVAGQQLTVTLPAPFTVSGAFLVEQVTLDYEVNGEAGVWWYTVRATQGPVSETWVQWFLRIVQPKASLIDVSSLGQQTQVAILAAYTAAWAWAATYTPTVYPCFLFTVTFPKTFC